MHVYQVKFFWVCVVCLPPLRLRLCVSVSVLRAFVSVCCVRVPRATHLQPCSSLRLPCGPTTATEKGKTHIEQLSFSSFPLPPPLLPPFLRRVLFPSCILPFILCTRLRNKVVWCKFDWWLLLERTPSTTFLSTFFGPLCPKTKKSSVPHSSLFFLPQKSSFG